MSTDTKAPRAPMLRRTKGDRDDLAMNLPEGKTCADCVHCYRCTRMFGHIPADEVCDWFPSRFQQAAPAAA
jgi:NADH dehydrogenase/NADH:ubiquinone oxidoreductase subunit G